MEDPILDNNTGPIFGDVDSGLMDGGTNGNEDLTNNIGGEVNQNWELSKEDYEAIGERTLKAAEGEKNKILNQNEFAPAASTETTELVANAEGPLDDAFNEAGFGSNQ